MAAHPVRSLCQIAVERGKKLLFARAGDDQLFAVHIHGEPVHPAHIPEIDEIALVAADKIFFGELIFRLAQGTRPLHDPRRRMEEKFVPDDFDVLDVAHGNDVDLPVVADAQNVELFLLNVLDGAPHAEREVGIYDGLYDKIKGLDLIPFDGKLLEGGDKDEGGDGIFLPQLARRLDPVHVVYDVDIHEDDVVTVIFAEKIRRTAIANVYEFFLYARRIALQKFCQNIRGGIFVFYDGDFDQSTFLRSRFSALQSSSTFFSSEIPSHKKSFIKEKNKSIFER